MNLAYIRIVAWRGCKTVSPHYLFTNINHLPKSPWIFQEVELATGTFYYNRSIAYHESTMVGNKTKARRKRALHQEEANRMERAVARGEGVLCKSEGKSY